MIGVGIAGAVEAAWPADSPRRRALVGALVPLSLAYGAGVALRNLLYDRGLARVTRVAATVVSVGNLTVGGSGKTPTVLWLADALARRGRRVGVVARGYGKRRPGTVVVGAGAGALLDPADGGDEAVLVATRLPLPVVTAERRADAAALACARFGCDTLVLDDGFQHRALARDADLVLVPADGLPRRLLPSGPLREPAAALRRARAVLALGDERALPRPPDVPPGVRGFVGRVVPTRLVVPSDGSFAAHDVALVPRRGVIAVAGVARPERFFALLERLGVGVGARLRFGDHHPYDVSDLERIRQATRGGAHAVVTTEKDLVKLVRLPGAEALALYALRIEVVIEHGDALVDLLLGTSEVELRRD